ncbi:MAG: dTDP-glucose 4,6-dehydratase [Acidimicrobiia bacterium]
MRLLVTGGAGFIGSNFVRYWRNEHPSDDLEVLDALTYAANPENIAGMQVPLHHVDLRDAAATSACMRLVQPHVIVHFAAESHNSLAVLDPSLFFQTNVIGTQNLLEAARNQGIERFHHVSTCEVYGDMDLDDSTPAFTETSPYRPRTPYNASKAGADHAVRCYGETYELPFTISNCANNYGPYQFPEKVLPLFVTRALQNADIPVYASSDHRREWVHALDHCSAIDRILNDGKAGETYHVGTGFERSVTQIADAVFEHIPETQSQRVSVPDRPGHDRRYLLDSSKITRELGWRPSIEWGTGVAETIEWYRSNRAWWEPLLERAPVFEDRWISQSGVDPS